MDVFEGVRGQEHIMVVIRIQYIFTGGLIFIQIYSLPTYKNIQFYMLTVQLGLHYQCLF